MPVVCDVCGLPKEICVCEELSGEHPDYLRTVPKGDRGWWALVFIGILLVFAAAWILART